MLVVNPVRFQVSLLILIIHRIPSACVAAIFHQSRQSILGLVDTCFAVQVFCEEADAGNGATVAAAGDMPVWWNDGVVTDRNKDLHKILKMALEGVIAKHTAFAIRVWIGCAEYGGRGKRSQQGDEREVLHVGEKDGGSSVKGFSSGRQTLEDL